MRLSLDSLLILAYRLTLTPTPSQHPSLIESGFPPLVSLNYGKIGVFLVQAA
jgi:hypothetical protein